ncbi:SDR family oxidoreductase [bacterium]|nr:SDR family oxidoreductase [bacterium]
MRICVIGGAGFIGVHTADHFARRGHELVVFDNLSRRGSRSNIQWLTERHPGLRFMGGDITRPRDLAHLVEKFPDIDVIIHLAAQVAVTTSVANPRQDFEINAAGTFNVLETARAMPRPPVVLFASTNKVYGGMEDVAVVEESDHYRYRDHPEGISESMTLDFHSPYGCSKGAADQYVRDYARIYGLSTVVFRQSCIYGTRQFGIEDQGWVAWFTIAALLDRPITIYGDGKQVRDVLYVEDLVAAYQAALDRIDQVSGRIYNIGGGPSHTRSLLALLAELEELLGKPIPRTFADWRPGDQPVYVSDIRKARAELGWAPRVDPRSGVEKLVLWVKENRDLIVRELGL